jgi:hypothetical protein
MSGSPLARPDPAPADHGVEQLELLSPAECAALRAAVHALRDSWRQRDSQLPFFTLGAASYLDAAGDYPAYASAARAINPLLAQRFGWLYERLAAKLARYFDAPVGYAPALALPGYHVYLAHRMFEQPLASVHCDTQYDLHDWSGFANADVARPMSFTLAIALPRCGGGLNTWDMDYAEYSTLTPSQLERRLAGRECVYVPYRCGSLALHSGHLVHQAAPAASVVEGDERITLQGHAVACDSGWVAYW